MLWLFIIFSVLVGAALPLQALVNARLGNVTAGPIFAATLSLLTGLVVLAIVLVFQRPAWPPVEQLVRLPGWMWVGGVVGVAYVVLAILGVPRIGAAGFVALVVLGQMIGSLIVDHYGVLHAAQPVNAGRIFGVVLVIAGMLLVLQPWRR